MGKDTGRARPGPIVSSMPEYVAFIRGINVGGHAVIPMEKLKRAFESLHFKSVRTLLASGNVVFQAPASPEPDLEKKIEKTLRKIFGREIGVLVRSLEALKRLAASQPFKGLEINPQTRLYVTFLPRGAKRKLPVSCVSPGGHFKILRATSGEVFSVLTLSPEGRTADVMKVLEKEFGGRITTRNYNTVLRVLKSLPSGTI